MTLNREVVLPASLEDLERLQTWVEEALEEADCDSPMAGRIGLVVEEVFVNIAKYAYDGQSGDARVRLRVERPWLVMEFEDQGKPFNPLDFPPPDISASLEDRPVGGLGIFLTVKMMDKVSYRRSEGKNCLTLWKNLSGLESGQKSGRNSGAAGE
ncbi:MAG: ATP-binding protein [Treponema sp.]|nr:ATP-binding protein [Treponema sp.]